ncbi:unnamed protein product [Rhizophagus irregularis]|nr:unnamed protein product [Rhizophagus irregularis]
MAIIVTFGEVRFRYSRFPKQQNVQENAKFQHEYSLIAETEMFGGSGAPGFPKRKCSGTPRFRNVNMFRCSRILKRKNVSNSGSSGILDFGKFRNKKNVAKLQFQSITSKLQFKWFGDIWEANLGNMNLVKPLLNRSHYFMFRYWIWLLKWLL